VIKALSQSAAPRVLLTTDAVGGVWTYAVDLAGGLARAGVETSLVVMGPSPAADQIDEARAVAGLALIDTRLPLDWMATEAAEIREVGAALRDLARGLGVELIQLNSPALAGEGGFSAPVVGVCHSCTATWWSTVKEGPMPADFRWRAHAHWQGMLACEELVAPSAAFAQATARTYEVPLPFVVHNGRRPQAVQVVPREPMVFTSGRLWDEGKNIAVLAAAAALIEAPLYAAGPLESPDGGAVRLAHARALGRLSAREVGEWLPRARIFASAARYEPFGLGVLEAAQAGCALVLSDIPTFRELWEGAAIFVPADDPRAFAEVFHQLLADPEEADRLGRLARVRAARYSVEAMVRGMLDIYRLRRPDCFGALRTEAAA
jgi:glycosyltransferase involved in cell wall biosynthesis